MELTNVDPATIDQIYKKSSISLCSNIAGQVTVGLMVNPPKVGDASYDLYHKETTAIYGMVRRKERGELSTHWPEFLKDSLDCFIDRCYFP